MSWGLGNPGSNLFLSSNIRLLIFWLGIAIPLWPLALWGKILFLSKFKLSRTDKWYLIKSLSQGTK